MGGPTIWGGELHLTTPKGNTFPVHPGNGRLGGEDCLPFYINILNLDIIVTFWDCFVVNYAHKFNIPVIHYLPIDAPLTWKMYEDIKHAYRIIAYSKFGFKQLLNFREEKEYIPPSKIEYIPHGIDTHVYKPSPEKNREKLRETLLTNRTDKPEDAIILLNVAVNAGERKCFPQLLIAFKKLLKTTNAYLYLFTNPIMMYPHGYDLRGLIRELKIPPDRVLFPPADPVLLPFEDEQLAELYSACDLYVTASLGEGFGIPLVESMACETPCVAPNNSTHTELIEGHGWLVETVPLEVWVDVPVWIPTLQQYPVVNISKLADTLKLACERNEQREEYGQEARRFIIDNYDWEAAGIINQWCNLFNRIEEELKILKVY